MKNTLFFPTARVHTISAIMLLSFLAISLFSGCSAGPSGPGGNSVGTQTTTIFGRVVDETGLPVAGASLVGGTGTATSDVNGFFIMKNATVTTGRALVIAKKAGYFSAAHAEVPNAKGTRIDLNMMSDAATATISGATGGLVNVTGGATVNFAAGSFTDASGVSYTGSVKVAARYLDPKNTNFFDFFDGDMMAQQADGSGASLISSGVLRVELKDGNGNALKLDPTKPATLNYPKPLDTKAPTTMPLWYFDESVGMWKESGSATLTNGMYTGTVTHFSDFNLDYIDSGKSFNTSGTVSMRIVCSLIPIGGVTITIVGDDNAGGKYFVHPGGRTDGAGKITFVRFPANRPVQVTVRSDKNGGLYYMNNPITVNIAPGEVKDLGDVSLDSPCPGGLTGTLTDCNGAKIEGLVSVSDGTHTSYTYTTTGDFGVQAAAGLFLSVDATDAAGNVATTTNIAALASGELRNIGSIKICGTNAVNFIDIPLAGTNDGGKVALSPDGSRLGVWSYSQLSVYDTKTGAILSQAPLTKQQYANGIQFSADGMKLLLYSNPATLYDVSGATATQLVSVNGSGIKLYDDGSAILTSLYVTGTGYEIAKYSAATGNLITTVTPTNFSDSAAVMGLINDEEALVYPDMKSSNADVWSIANNSQSRSFSVLGSSYSFSASDDGLEIATSSDYKTFNFFDTKTGTKTNSINMGGSSTTYHIVLTKNYAYSSMPVTGAGVINSFKISDGTSVVHLMPSSPISFAVSRNDKYLAASYSGKVRLWKLQ
jgi:hypothetical protein